MANQLARPAASFRAARRNAARGFIWDQRSYFRGHRANDRRATVLSRRPSRYHPLKAVGDYLRSLGRVWIGSKRAA